MLLFLLFFHAPAVVLFHVLVVANVYAAPDRRLLLPDAVIVVAHRSSANIWVEFNGNFSGYI
jgi:hypothetical protein